jgi:hypothetical protein
MDCDEESLIMKKSEDSVHEKKTWRVKSGMKSEL